MPQTSPTSPSLTRQKELEQKAQGIIKSYELEHPDKALPSSPSKHSPFLKIALLSAVLFTIGGTAAFLVNLKKPETGNIAPIAAKPVNLHTPAPTVKGDATRSAAILNSTTRDWDEYSYKPLGIKFRYPDADFEIVEEVRTKADEPLEAGAQERFYIELNKTAPELIYKAEVLPIVSEDETIDLDQVPFRLHIFLNPQNLSGIDWFQQYQYFPYEWGDKTLENPPTQTLTRSDVIGDYAHEVDSKNVKFILFNHNSKMYLLWLGQIDLASRKERVKNILSSFDFTQNNETIYENQEFNFSFRFPEKLGTITQEGNKIHINKPPDSDEDQELQTAAQQEPLRTFTIFVANTKDLADLKSWWSQNIYSDVGHYSIPDDYDGVQKATHPTILNSNGIQLPTLIITPKVTAQDIQIYEDSYYIYFDFGKPFILHYTSNFEEDIQDLDWPLETIGQLNF
jgi:hypothetical protein